MSSSQNISFSQSLKQASEKARCSPYKNAQNEFIDFLDKEVFQLYLRSPAQIPLNEIFCCNDPSIVHNYIRGSMKAAIHNGLRDPNLFLGVSVFLFRESILIEFYYYNLITIITVRLLYCRTWNSSNASRHKHCIQIAFRIEKNDQYVWLVTGETIRVIIICGVLLSYPSQYFKFIKFSYLDFRGNSRSKWQVKWRWSWSRIVVSF